MKNRNITWGLILTVIGIAWFASIFNLVPRDINIWRMIITGGLVVASLSALPRLDWFGILMPLGFALIFNQELFNIENQGWNIFLATLVLSTGFSIIFRKRRKKNYFTFSYSGDSSRKDRKDDDHVIDIEIDTSDSEKKTSDYSGYAGDEYVEVTNNFGDRSSYVHSSGLKRANLENNFGHMRVYFDNANMTQGCEISVDNNLGKVTLYLPRTYCYRNNIASSMGSVEDSERFDRNAETIVYLRGETNLGAVEIIYV